MPARNTNPASAADAAARLVEIEQLITRLAATGKKVLVVGPAAIVGNPKASQTSLFKIPSHCEFAHFNAVRGVDHWKDFDAVLLIGRNEPPIAATEDIARAVFCDDPQPLNLTGAWQYQPRGYRLAGQRRGVDAAVHADPRVQAVVEQLRECESVQAIDRLRLIHNIKNKTVIILSSLPLDLDVDETRSWNELMHGTRLEQAWDACAGVLPLNPAWLAANYPNLWPTSEAAKSDVQRAIKKRQLSNMTSTGKLIPFDFRTAGQRQWSKALSASNDAGHVATALKGLLGQDATVRPSKPRP